MFQCPTCKSPEEHPTKSDQILIRAFKVSDDKGDWSQCLVCSGYYTKNLEVTAENHNPKKGWFVT